MPVKLRIATFNLESLDGKPGEKPTLDEGQGIILDHLLVSRTLLAHCRGSEIHNELLHDESIALATDKQYPESDCAPFIAEF